MGATEWHQRLTVQGAWKSEPRAIVKGSLFVPIAQPKAPLVMAILAPQGPDSLLAWGAFNNAFARRHSSWDVRATPAPLKSINMRASTFSCNHY